jgi:hypothetical protein
LKKSPIPKFCVCDVRLENPCVGGSIPPRATKNAVSTHNAHSCKWALSFLDMVYWCLVRFRSSVDAHLALVPYPLSNASACVSAGRLPIMKSGFEPTIWEMRDGYTDEWAVQ